MKQPLESAVADDSAWNTGASGIRRHTVPGVSMLFLLFCVLWSGAVRPAGLDARLDRIQVAEGETVNLTLVAAGDSNGTPDLSPLNQDFDLVSQGQSTRLSIVNGKRSSTREWQLVLAPKRTGRLRVPSLSLGGLSSVPLDLEVLPQAQMAQSGKAPPLLLEVELEPESPYVQGQAIYRVRILMGRVMPTQASLSDPEAEGVVIERLGEDEKYRTTRDGREYQVIQRSYALFPQSSGRIDIEPPVLNAQIPVSGRRGDNLRERFFGRGMLPDMDSFFQNTRAIRLRGQALSLDVRPRPANAGSSWLPAQSLALSESWSPDPPEFRVGEPVTRNIAITAQGLTAAQLPDLSMRVPDGVKLYPDKPLAQTRPEGNTLVAQKVVKAAIVASRPGRLTLPEIRLDWWDTQSDTPQVAILPARTIEVLPAPTHGATAPESPGIEQAPARRPAEPERGTQFPAGLTTLPGGHWPWLAGALALAWLFTLVAWLRARGRPLAVAKEPAAPAVSGADPAEALRRLRRACRANDPREARAALLEWAAGRWPSRPPRRLDELAHRLEASSHAPLQELDRVLYAEGGGAWQGEAAWNILQATLAAADRDERADGSASDLPDLYPRSA